MDKVTVYLRTALFSFGEAEGHLPHGVHAIAGEVVERTAAALVLRTEQLFDYDGQELAAEPHLLELPWPKIDHVVRRSEG